MNKRYYLLLSVCAVGVTALTAAKLHRPSKRASFSAYTTSAGAKVSPMARALRPIYPYSVTPGGVYSPAELRSALDRDALLRRHYIGFDSNKLKLVGLTDDRYAFVSFRQNGQFFWTRKRLKIPRGEILLTDGRNYAKTRCGNRLSDTRMQPTTPSEVSADVLSPPPLSAEELPNLTFARPGWSEISQVASSLPMQRGPFAPSVWGVSLGGNGSAGRVFTGPGLGIASGGIAGGGGIWGGGGIPSGGHTPGGDPPPVVLPPVPITPILPVPEPSLKWLWVIGCVALLAFRRKRGCCRITKYFTW